MNSLPGLETLDGNLFITVAFGDYFKAFIEGLAKLIHVVQLDCKLHNLDLRLLHWLSLHLGLFDGLGLQLVNDLHLQEDRLAKFTTFGSTESEFELEDVVRNDGVLSDLDWDCEVESLHTLDFNHVDGKVDNFDRHTGQLHGLVHSEEDSSLPAPVGVVLDLEVGKDHLTGHTLEDFLRLADDDGSLHLVLAFASASTFTTGELP
mgnify:CR=1 FL=1